MVEETLRKSMEANPLWEIFDWHPLNPVLKQRKRTAEPEASEEHDNQSDQGTPRNETEE